MPKKLKNQNYQVHKELGTLDIAINEFGEIISNFDIQKVNEFLDTHVNDKKFKNLNVVRTNEKCF